MIDEMPPIQVLHGIYQDLSGLIITLSFDKICMWREWMARGFTPDDLRLTMRMILRKVGGEREAIRIFRFRFFIGMPDRFDEDLAEARAMQRVVRPPPNKSAVLRSTGRPAQQFFADTAKSAEDIMKADAGLAALLRLRDSL